MAAVTTGCRFWFDALPAGDDAQSDAAVGDADAPGNDAPTDSASVTCPTSYVTLAGQGSKYRVISSSEEWLISEAACEADGTHLMIPDSSEEISAIQTVLPATSFWTGVTDRKIVGTWRKVTGPIATFLPWGLSEPDASAPECVYVDGLTLQLVDQDCISGRRAVCECDGAAVDPTSY